MSDLVDRITDVLRRDGWTCEYHEPVNGPGECSQCDDAHRRTAERVAEALNLREERIHADDPLYEPGQRRWVSPWTAVEGKP